MNAQELVELKKSLELKKSQYDKALGSLDNVKRQLKDLGFNNLKDLREAIDKKTEQLETLKTALVQEESEWRSKYNDLISTP
ncbi:MAG: hypothetical protein PHI42_07965 [Paludibacteraceae bacterium]|nr:hypothetical protein [Paludibacteraceae bacterium]